MDGQEIVIYLIIIVAHLIISALFSASETAFAAVNKSRLRELEEKGNKRAKMAIKILEKFNNTLTTVLICNNIVNMSASAIVTVIVTKNLGEGYVALGTAVITALVILFTEILPKNMATEFPLKFCLFIAYPLNFVCVLFSPLVWILIKLKDLVIKLCGGENNEPTVTERDLIDIIDEIEDEGVMDESETDLVKSAVEFSDITISEILIPRVNILAVDIEDTIDEIKEVFLSSHFSRIPVYEKTIDNIVGIIHEKNFYSMYLAGGRDINTIIQKPLYIFEMTSISDIMNEMQRAKSHMAIVVDQYGGTQGIVTMEDIIEELVGDIYDETDEEDNSCIKTGENEYEVSADVSIRDFLEFIELEDEEIETDCTSIGGLVMENLDHIPEPGESVECAFFNITVISADEQRIDRVKIVVTPPKDEEDDEDEDDE